MKIQLKKLNCQPGAPMGRANARLEGKCRLQRVHFIDGAYDNGGAYWGMGLPLYVAEDCEGNQAFVRAKNREEAKKILMEKDEIATPIQRR